VSLSTLEAAPPARIIARSAQHAMSDSPIRSAIARDREQRGIALMPFIAAGFPDLASTTATIRSLAAAGATLLEVGFPFSDPIADGPTIQAAFTAALEKGTKVADVFAAVRASRDATTQHVPLVAMLSYSVVFRYGLDRFLSEAKTAGFSGLILPDLPPPEAAKVTDTIRVAGLDTTLLVAPTTPPDRRAQIARLCSGFIYYLSVSGITGERDRLPPDVAGNVRDLKIAAGEVPVCVGFGIHRPQQVADLVGVADGAIVGTAMVRRMKDHAQQGPQAVAEAAGDYCRDLLSNLRNDGKSAT
jgi:tryptophan synthase alpha chain